MAAYIKEQMGLETDLVEGGRGEFTVWVGDRRVAQKDTDGFPTERQVVSAIQQALGSH